MSTHPIIPLDEALIDDVAARLDLRAPNSEALAAVATALDSAAGEPINVVCDLATAVGKTYLAAGLIDYLASSGVRHFLIVTPGRTIQSKTINNFAPGHPKSVLGGMSCQPVVITTDNFNTGATAAALADDTLVKLFVFNVQQLIRPTTTVRRRTRTHQEWLGTNLYEHLTSADDLVVLADECHVYTERATAFNNAVAGLDAMAVVGLTATPSATDQERVIYHYPLARAIGDRYVKTPVLVGRTDDASDTETRLRDGLALLATKQAAADAYAAATGTPVVNAVMFVVADSIDNANAVAEVLSKPGMLDGDYDQQVLVIHSDAPDDALARLEAVEEPTSSVRVIVSVSMLKEGWDVKNIFVICSLRPSISEVLTEQTLGRGLRLPWGAYTDIELLDTVEVISHERYRDLLRRADVLLEGLVETREQLPLPGTQPPVGPETTAAQDALADDGVPPATGTELGGEDASGGDSSATGTVCGTEPAPVSAAASATPVAGTPTILPLAERLDQATEEAAGTREIAPSRILTIPQVTVTLRARTFELSEVPDAAFTQIGQQLAAVTGGQLTRKVLDVVPDAASESGYRLIPRDATDIIVAAQPHLPFGGAEAALADFIYGLDIVSESRGNRGAAARLARAIVNGAGGEEQIAAYLNTARDTARIALHAAYRSVPEERELSLSSTTLDRVRVTAHPAQPNRFGAFSRRTLYTGWHRSQYPGEWFDSSPERDLANLMDGAEEVEIWTRLHRGELVIAWQHRRYNPDFYAIINRDHYLLEVKSDRHADDADVQARAQAAEEWARYVVDHGDHGNWQYLLIPERTLKTARTLSAVLTQAANR